MPRAQVPAGLLDGPPVTTYPRAIKFLGLLQNVERRRLVRYDDSCFDLSKMRDLLERVGNPHADLTIVHVAGTKGKGSTCLILDAMLRANGYKVGLYTSPHLVDLRERVRVGGAAGSLMIPQATLVRHCAALADAVAAMAAEDRVPSHFDVLTALALMHFAEESVDVAVLETGLGGRLDSTNVVTPAVCAFTPISEDHRAVLGDTVEQIAAEKAGIMKRGVPAVSVPQRDGVTPVLRAAADDAGARLHVLGEDGDFSVRFEADDQVSRHNLLCLTSGELHLEHFPVPLIGEHQAINVGLALAVLEALRGRGLSTDPAVSLAALETVELPARMELISRQPHVVVDAAHNPASIEALLRSMNQIAPHEARVLVLGLLADKDVEAILRCVCRGADKVVFTSVDSPRGADPHDLRAIYDEVCGKDAQVAETLPEALDAAKRAARRDDIICVTGSFGLAGAARELLLSDKI